MKVSERRDDGMSTHARVRQTSSTTVSDEMGIAPSSHKKMPISHLLFDRMFGRPALSEFTAMYKIADVSLHEG